MSNTKKVSLLAKINYIFDKKQKGQLFILAVLILIGGVVETLGVSMMIPVISVILKPESLHRQIEKYDILQNIVNVLGLNTDLKLASALLISLIFLFIFNRLFFSRIIYLFGCSRS